MLKTAGKKIICILAGAIMICLLAEPALLGTELYPAAQAAEGYEAVASYSEMGAVRDTLRYGMTPIYPEDVEDGTYVVGTECSSPYFRILEAKVTVSEGEMTAVLTMATESYSHVYLGTPEEAAAAPYEDYIPLVSENGRFTFTIPLEAFNAGINLASFSVNRQKWYGRQVVFDAGTLPRGVTSYVIPDYDRIEDAIRLYDITRGTNSVGELYAGMVDDEDAGSPRRLGEPVEPIAMEEADGVYSIDVDMTGGSGRASVTSPTWLIVEDGKGYAKLLWSSSYYDYMVVGGETFYNQTTDGSNSTFVIPITAMNEPMRVIADTTAMGDPLEIEYELTFYADSIGGRGRVPQEASKTVILVALVIIIGGGIVNYFVKKRQKR